MMRGSKKLAHCILTASNKSLNLSTHTHIMKMPEQCFECEKGQLVEIVQDYTDEGPDGASVVVPSVKMQTNRGLISATKQDHD